MSRKRPDPPRLCIGCGYDLRGSRAGGRCPECGLPAYVPTGPDDPFSAMPIETVGRFRTAAALAIVCLALAVVALIGGPRNSPLTLGAAVLWFASIWLLTPAVAHPHAHARGFGPAGRLRQAARLLQGGWVIAAAAPPALRGTGPALEIVLFAGVAIGLAGIVCLAILLSHLAEWVRDGAAERAFDLAAWSIPITTALLLAAAIGLRVPFLLLGAFLTLLWVGSIISFSYALLSLGRSLAWAVVHSREHQERLRRRQERAEAYDAEVAQSIDAIDRATKGGSP